MEENKKKTAYGLLSRSASKKLASSFKGPNGQSVVNQIKAGQNTFLKYERIINASYDNRWVTEIEECIGDISSIIRDPLRITKEVTDVVPIELARKVNAESVSHLSTHPQFIKEQTEDGELIINKILNIGSDDFYQTYENKFIATLIRKLVIFVEKRYQYLEENQKIKRSSVMMLKNKSVIDGREVEIETKVTITKEEKTDDNVNTNRAFMARVKELQKYMLFFYNSPFMKLMKTESNVRSPIIMTNIIRKNPIYNHCYKLYQFIESYDLLGVNFKVNDKYTQFDEEEKNDLSDILAANFLSIKPEETERNIKEKFRAYNPKVITNTDDDEFVYGPYYKGPIEYVRADEKYMKYLDAIIKPTPIHPTKEERLYYGAEIALRKEIRDELKQIQELLARKLKNYERVYEEFERIVKQREFEAFQLSEQRRREAEEQLLRELEEARLELMKNAQDDNGIEPEPPSPFENLEKHELLSFSERLEASDDSLKEAYKQIQHTALCFGLYSKISKKGESFRYHGKTYMKIGIIGKSLRCHYALEPLDYENSSIPVIDDTNVKQYEDVPLLLKVRSDLSVKRAIKLINDLAEKFGFNWDENIKPEQYDVEKEEEKVVEEIDPFANIKKNEFVPFSTRVENADPALADAYKQIRHRALCYGLHSRVSKKADTLRLHGTTYLKIAVVGKSLKLHYALNPSDYENTSIPYKDDSDMKQYEDIPLMFKVRSELSVKRAIKLVDDLAEKYQLEFDENIKEDQIEIDETAQEPEEPEEIEEATQEPAPVPVEVPVIVASSEASEGAEEVGAAVNPFANFKHGEFVCFSQRIKDAEPELAKAYEEIRHHALCYGLHSRISKKCETMRLHAVTYIKIAVVGKTLKLHFALEPSDYANTTLPIKDDSGMKQYEDVPLMFKVRSELSVKRALKLIDDLAAKNEFIYNEVIDESQFEIDDTETNEPDEIEEVETPAPVETPVAIAPAVIVEGEGKAVEETDEDDESASVSNNPFANFKHGEFVPFEKRIEQADKDLYDAYVQIRHLALCYGLHSRISQKAETFRLRTITYMRMCVVGKTLKCHFALNPEDYADTTLPFKDESSMKQYEDIPLMFKVRSELSVKRALKLVEDLAHKYDFVYNEEIDESQYESDEKEQKPVKVVVQEETPVVEKIDTVVENNEPKVVETVEESDEVAAGSDNPFASFKHGEFVPFEKRIEQASKETSDAYREIKHHAICYGMRSRISNKGETFKCQGKVLLKIALVGKTLKLHYALNPLSYANSTIPVEDDSNMKQYEDVPLLFRVRSDLSVKRALKLIDDMASENELVFDENAVETDENDSEIDTVDENEVAQDLKNTSTSNGNIYSSVVVGGTAPSSSLDQSDIKVGNIHTPVDVGEDDSFDILVAYATIKHQALCYGLHLNRNKEYEAFLNDKEEVLRIVIAGSIIKVYYALNPANYENSKISVTDCRREGIITDTPLLFKIGSKAALKQSITLLEDLAVAHDLKYSNKFDEALVGKNEKAITVAETNTVVIEPTVEESADVINVPVNKFSNIKTKKMVPFAVKVTKLESQLVAAYAEIKALLESKDLHSRISNKFDTYKLHNDILVKISVIGKGIRIHYALDPKDYEGSTIPVSDHSDKATYREVPLELKVRSGLSIKRAFMLFDDLFVKFKLTDEVEKKEE